MIKEIIVLSRLEAELLCYGVGKPPENKWILISICSPKDEMIRNNDVKNQLEKGGCVDWISIIFDDVTEELYKKVKKMRPDVIVKLFSEKDAKLIIDFIEKHKDNIEELTLIIHCHAGVSRSGAIGWFACNLLELDKDKFLQQNKTLYPNKYILQTIESLSGIKPTSEDEYKNHFNTIDF